MYYANEQAGGVDLDCDVTRGCGPETLTVTIESGVDYWYFFAHHMYREEGKSFAESGAKARIIGLPGYDEITCPSGASVQYGSNGLKGYWHIFAIQSGVVRVVNKIVADSQGTDRRF